RSHAGLECGAKCSVIVANEIFRCAVPRKRFGDLPRKPLCRWVSGHGNPQQLPASTADVRTMDDGWISDRSPPYRRHPLGRTMILDSLIPSPSRPTEKWELTPPDACLFSYFCPGWGATLRPKPGVCCVFCSCGSFPCPPIQAERSGETGAASCCTG